jgi:hypothetical protein
MRTTIKRLLRFLILLALFSAPHLASAYYDPGVQRWINRDLLGESGFGAARNAFSIKRAPFQEASEYAQGANLYEALANSPLSVIDSNGLELMPPKGPSSPIGTPIHKQSDGGCFARCMAANGAGPALAALGISTGTVGTLTKWPLYRTIPGFSPYTTGFSIMQNLFGLPLRSLGRLLNPYGTAVQCASASWLLGLAAGCGNMCENDPNAF